MTNAAPSLRASNPSRGATDPAFGVDRDLESELMAGLSGPVRKRAKALASVAEDATDKEDADAPLPEALEAPRAAIDAGLEAALIEGLSEPVRERAETLASAAAIPADAERADADAPPPEAFEAPRAGIDAGLEAALIESLSSPVRSGQRRSRPMRRSWPTRRRRTRLRPHRNLRKDPTRSPTPFPALGTRTTRRSPTCPRPRRTLRKCPVRRSTPASRPP